MFILLNKGGGEENLMSAHGGRLRISYLLAFYLKHESNISQIFDKL